MTRSADVELHPPIGTRLIWRRGPGSALARDRDLAAHWDRLNDGRLGLPFLTARAVSAALETFGDGKECLFVGTTGGDPVAMLLLEPQGALRWRSFQPSQSPLGPWVAAPGWTLESLGRSLLDGPLWRCLALSITQVDPLMEHPTEDTPGSRTSPYIDTAWIDIEGGFSDYWAARGKNLRQNMRKQRNKLDADGTMATMLVWRGREDMAPALARYGLLESQGWKAGRGTAIAPDNDQGRYYTRLLEEAAERGEAVVFEYRLNDRTAAMNLCLLRRGVLVVLKTAYDESLPKSLSPAFLLREEELQYIFAGQEIRRIEYYGRVMDWHTKFTDSKRSLYHLTLFRWPWLKRLAERRRSAYIDLASTVEVSTGSAESTPASA